jgi:nicotinamide-nucleotide adenylyltransferase
MHRDACQSLYDDRPEIKLVRSGPALCGRIGIFSSSFNPPTTAHLEIIRRASQEFALDQVLALVSLANADKSEYECELEHRVGMVVAAAEQSTSVGIVSHAFYADMIDPLETLFPSASLHFIVGFDTFERVLDRDSRYIGRYHRGFTRRDEVLEYVLSRTRMIVSNRAGAGMDQVDRLLANEAGWLRERVLQMKLPEALAARSATEVRNRISANQPVAQLVPAQVEAYISKHGLYRHADVES